MTLVAVLLHCSHCKPLPKEKNPYVIKGIISLDSITFPRLIPSSDHAYIVAFFNKSAVNSDRLHAVYRDVVRSFSWDIEDHMMVAQVIVKDGDNTELLEKYNINSLPHVLVFGASNSVPVSVSRDSITISGFADAVDDIVGRAHYLRLPQPLWEYHDIVSAFANSGGGKEGAQDRASAIASAKRIMETLSFSDHKNMAKYFVKVMEGALSKGGRGYIKRELARLRRMMLADMSDVKLEELERKIGVLHMFLGLKLGSD
eukprot:CAMPEP_0185041136 /NCGR_PEP_ID=MMETSP1103-20130426/40029_1 /TAXON_ID=36769 /ORGANISM="Paraphysomonas bandaiensis, Strain Caron Lab Isolate" /LENGTH=257 /DNA_ID=CAMNT_0027580739 /DNA_START=9 /DNA_END=779 /DNA_ORIENTATION=-